MEMNGIFGQAKAMVIILMRRYERGDGRKFWDILLGVPVLNLDQLFGATTGLF